MDYCFIFANVASKLREKKIKSGRKRDMSIKETVHGAEEII
jgi:hypothetical protein